MDVSNKILIICTAFNFPKELSQTIPCLMAILEARDDVQLTIIDNFSKDLEVHQQLDALNHPRLNIIKNKVNYGKAIASNRYIADTLSLSNCPRILISMDSDLEFQVRDFHKLVELLDHAPHLGMMSMRYKNNACNPERSMWWPSKSIHYNNKTVKIKCPVFANVPGGFFGIQGYVLSHYLNFKLFPKSKNEVNFKQGHVKRAGSDDAFLYDYLKKHKLVQGYLNGTEITHLKSPPPETKNYIS